MIDLREKRRRFKRKFPESCDELATQPKETILDMSVSKLAKAKTQVHLEQSLRKTVMIVNTIRRLEGELDNGCVKGATVERHCVRSDKEADMRLRHDCPMPKTDLSTTTHTTTTDVSSLRLSGSLTDHNNLACNNKIETFPNDRYSDHNLTTCDRTEMTLVDLSPRKKEQANTKMIFNKLISAPHNSALVPDAEINFAEIDISLYDFDAWTDGSVHLAFEDNEHVYKTPNNGLSSLIRRCSSDLKLNKVADTSFTDDLDQIMQVLVGI